MPIIEEVHPREIIDSRGNPTVEVDVILESGDFGRAQVPSGASTGKYECMELRDGDESRFLGKGVLKAIENIEETITPEIVGLDALDQREIDSILIDLDATGDKSRLGANAILAVSLAVARAAANFLEIPLFRYLGGAGAHLLPIPLMNVFNGGRHADNNLDFQEFMIAPINAANFREALRIGAEIYQQLKQILKRRRKNTSVGDEGGFAPNSNSHQEVIELLVEAIESRGFKAGKEVAIALDPAASEFYNNGMYELKGERKKLSPAEMINYYERLVAKYPIFSIEDGMSEEDWDGWVNLTKKIGQKVQLVGDDLFVTNIQRLEEGIKKKAANAILIKLNQIGTLTETIDVIERAKKAGYIAIVSHRSGETEDTFISDFSVATGVGQIKSGAPCRGERVAKYNQLLRIEEELGENARIARIKYV